MSAFGKKPGLTPGRPSFGVARPMSGGGSAPSNNAPAPAPMPQPEPMQPEGGEQFPPLHSVELPGAVASPPSDKMQDAPG